MRFTFTFPILTNTFTISRFRNEWMFLVRLLLGKRPICLWDKKHRSSSIQCVQTISTINEKRSINFINLERGDFIRSKIDSTLSFDLDHSGMRVRVRRVRVKKDIPAPIYYAECSLCSKLIPEAVDDSPNACIKKCGMSSIMIVYDICLLWERNVWTAKKIWEGCHKRWRTYSSVQNQYWIRWNAPYYEHHWLQFLFIHWKMVLRVSHCRNK